MRKSFKFMVSKISPRFFSLLLRQKEITSFSWGWGGGGGMMELPELNLRGYWSQVSINSTIFATFTFSVSVFCFAVSSFSFKHAEVWRLFNLTSKIFTKNYGAQEQLHKTHNLKTMLPYFLTISPTISQVKSLSLSFFPILKSFIPLFY